MLDSLNCPECGGSIKEDVSRGECFCSKCGLVVEDKIFDTIFLTHEGQRKYRNQYEKRLYENMGEIRKIVNKLNLPSDVHEELKRFFLINYQKKYTKGRPFRITIVALLLSLLDIYILLILDKMTTEDYEKSNKLNENRKKLESMFATIKKDFPNEYEKAIKTLDLYYRPKLSRFLKNEFKEIEKRTGIPLKLSIFDIREVDKNHYYAYNPTFHKLFKIKSKPLSSYTTDKMEEEKIEYAKVIRNRGITFSINFIKNLDNSKRQLTKKGLVCACCYLIADYYKNGSWIAPCSKIEWMRFFHIDSKTFYSRIKELMNIQCKWEELSGISNVKIMEN